MTAYDDAMDALEVGGIARLPDDKWLRITAGTLRAEIAAAEQRGRVAALREACRAIEKRRCARRMRWMRRPRWSGEIEARWSQGMWDAAAIVYRLTERADRTERGEP